MPILNIFPWEGGVVTSIDEALIQPTRLTVGDNIIYSETNSKKQRDGISWNYDNSTTTASKNIIGLIDMWYGNSNSRTQRRIATVDDGVVLLDNGGSVSALTVTGTAVSSPTKVSMCVYNNKLFCAFDGSTNVLKAYAPLTSTTNFVDATWISGFAASKHPTIIQEHLGRLWCNQKDNPDRLHYCEVGDDTKWGGDGDSGAFDIGIGDGDPEGITAIFPTFNGDLYVAKRTKLYRIVGVAPETMQFIKISDSIGCVGPNAYAALDKDDILFVSTRGVHSLRQVLVSDGNIEATYVSSDIQRSFNDDWKKSRYGQIWGAYNPTTNSAYFAYTDQNLSKTYIDKSKELFGSSNGLTTSINNALWVYNQDKAAWHRWLPVSCQSMCVANDTDKPRLYFGSHVKRIGKDSTSTKHDVSHSGSNVAIRQEITTGRIFPSGDPSAINVFRKVGVLFKPQGSINFVLTAHVENQSPSSSNTISVSITDGAHLLGSTFVLGSSVWGAEASTEPYMYSIDGQGRSIKLQILKTTTAETLDIQGLLIEYEPLRHIQETEGNATT